ncbi:hypothetical protein Metli_1838 [Methanofollis liminatans DSM 4140]|jgi:hypothetical protein|uniref:Argininosuccinate synthase n=1 Tax=Methanofollis liminatans DSM 4140 TaxID=28892 RepID=J1L3W2_9EURY|nr:hypothetical protein [Methanofollis liminatans]EJG07782.1 hypothetical protein Metli_1838 [Methanofollis liminatans DSM 4140]
MKKQIFLTVFAVALAVILVSLPAAAATTEVHLVRYAADGSTVLDEMAVDYLWMEANLPVLGDGLTHYYHQGPTFNESDLWDPAEYQNVETRDMGAVKGTAVSDLCDLVGGMAPGDILRVQAKDGFYKNFSYQTVYGEDGRKGVMGLAWYVGQDSVTGDPQGEGYVPDYYDGMRLIFFADTSANPWGWHVFGDNDMRETMPEDEWHLFSGKWPSSSGLSVKHVNKLLIYPGEGTEGGDTSPDLPPTQASPLGIAVLLAALAVGIALRI